jgi:hypothetical protein
MTALELEDKLFSLRERIKDLAREYGDERSCTTYNGWPRCRKPEEVLAALESAVDEFAALAFPSPESAKLTDEQIESIWDSTALRDDRVFAFARAIERALTETAPC